MKIFIETYGCDTNKVSTEIMAAHLLKAGHTFASKDDAELIIINSCILNPSTERKLLARLSELQNSNARVLVMGCMAEVQKESITQRLPEASVAGVASVSNIAEIVKKIEGGLKVLRLSDTPRQLIGEERARINPATAIVQIATGCLENCVFCVDRSAMGSLQSYGPDRILDEIKKATLDGCIEIHISAQDVSSYGKDTGVKLPALLRKMAIIAGKYRVKLGAMNPATVLPILEDLIPAFNRPNMYQYLDLPLQSGSNKILREMKRNYTREEYMKIVHDFRNKYPNMAISTDVIVGFPGETDDDFRQTVELISEIKPAELNVFAYGAMPLTKAEATDVLSWKIKDRYFELEKLGKKLKEEALKKWIGWSGEVFVTERTLGGNVGRNYAYMPILVGSAHAGDIRQCSVSGSNGEYLLGN